MFSPKYEKNAINNRKQMSKCEIKQTKFPVIKTDLLIRNSKKTPKRGADVGRWYRAAYILRSHIKILCNIFFYFADGFWFSKLFRCTVVLCMLSMRVVRWIISQALAHAFDQP